MHFGGYFSNNSSNLTAADKTEYMTLKSNSIVHKIIDDDTPKIATQVKVIDAEPKNNDKKAVLYR